ncbi:MAG: carbohydrate ABC transporter permease [Actinomycetota bacterium]
MATYAFLVVIATINVFPFIWMLVTSFKSPGSVFDIPPNLNPDLLWTEQRFDAYREVLVEENFVRFLLNSMLIATVTAIGQVVTGSLAGFAFAKLQFWGRDVLFGILLISSIVPVEVTIIPEFILVDRLGWADSYLPLIVPSWLVGTLGTFLYREAFKTVPGELSEAAAVDGAGVFRIYWSIYMPLSVPVTVTLFLIAFINSWNELLRPVLYISSENLRTVTLGLTTFQSEHNAEWDLLMAASVVAIVPLLLVYVLGQRWIVQGIATQGLKG